MNWVNGELQGYKNIQDVPKYRILKGNPQGTYFIHSRVQYTNASVPLRHFLPEEDVETLITLHVDNSITSIQNVLNGENRENFSKLIPKKLDFFRYFRKAPFLEQVFCPE
jgi:hypothetical protein